MDAFEFPQLVEEQQASGKLYLEFLRVPAMSMGIYKLPADGTDPQSPHTEDEVYVVLNGRGQISVDGEDRLVEKGSIVFVAKQIEHHFHSIEDDLQILVFFAPAES